MKINELTIGLARAGLKNKEFSAKELTNACLEQIKEKDDKINAFISVLEERALAQAEVIDKKIAAKEKLGALAGVPMALKDNIVLEGVKATAGSKILEHHVAAYDATVVSKLKKAGAIFLGKTNMDEFAMGGSGETSYFGPTRNPHNLKKVPGGSSSGSAAAVAAHEAIFALGSDTGGSVRQPAAFCGVVGFKPSYGRVSRHGLMAMASSLDQIGPLTKNVEDAALVFEAIAGADGFDSTATSGTPFTADCLKKDLGKLRIGVPQEFFVKGMDPKIEQLVWQAADKLKNFGAEIVEVSLPRAAYALAVYYILMPAEVSSNLARYDGVRYGHQAAAGNLQEMYLKTRSEGFGDEVKRRLLLGTYVLSSGYYDAYYKKAQQVRRLITEDFNRVFETVDCLLTPTTPTTAFGLGEKFDDPLTMYLADIFTVPVNIAGLPAISLPGGLLKKMPVGIQLIGSYFGEEKLLKVAYHLEQNH